MGTKIGMGATNKGSKSNAELLKENEALKAKVAELEAKQDGGTNSGNSSGSTGSKKSSK